MLLLIDLDDTLITRSESFRQWAENFVARTTQRDEDVTWLLETDNGGNCPRLDFAQLVGERFGLSGTPRQILDEHVSSHLTAVVLYEGVLEKLREFRAEDWKIVIVTNGLTARQHAKIAHSGIGQYADAVVVGEEVSEPKPSAVMFEKALSLVSYTGNVWMVGDNPVADIFGAQQMGFHTAWISHGRQWTGKETPTLVAETPVDALELVLRHTS